MHFRRWPGLCHNRGTSTENTTRQRGTTLRIATIGLIFTRSHLVVPDYDTSGFCRYAAGDLPVISRKAVVNQVTLLKPLCWATCLIVIWVCDNNCMARSTRHRRISSNGDRPRTARNFRSSARRVVATSSTTSFTVNCLPACSLMNRTALRTCSSTIAMLPVDCRSAMPSGGIEW
jgi:hypothetical protein